MASFVSYDSAGASGLALPNSTQQQRREMMQGMYGHLVNSIRTAHFRKHVN